MRVIRCDTDNIGNGEKRKENMVELVIMLMMSMTKFIIMCVCSCVCVYEYVRFSR